MKRIQIALFTLIFCFVITSCTMNMGHDPGLPHPTSITELRQTMFVPTLENKITDNKNVIYCPTLLYAWGIVKRTFNDSITLKDPTSTEFKLLNQSTSFHNSLNSDENMSEADFSDGKVRVRSFFKKALPFLTKFQKLDEGILFGKTKVNSFGMKHIENFIANFTQIVSYMDDDHFAIKIIPIDTLNEIFLVKGLGNIKTLAEAVKQTDVLIKNGRKEMLNPRSLWKYCFNDDDKLSIPSIKFNREEHYKNIEGQQFLYVKKIYTVEAAYQKTAFTLDEKGVYAESEANFDYAGLDTASTIKTHPKHLIFDKPFYIIINHINRNPYFVMKVENAELLKKM